MGYQETITELATRYFMELLPEYQDLAREFMKHGRKLNLFRKVEYRKYIDDLQKMKENAAGMIQELVDLEIPEEDPKGENLAEYFIEALEDFQKVCDRGVAFNEVMAKKQDRKPVKVDDIRLAVQGMQLGAKSAGESAAELDRKYRVYVGVLSEDEEPENGENPESTEAENAPESQDDEEGGTAGESKSGKSSGQDPDDRFAEEDEGELLTSRRPRIYRKEIFNDETE